MEDYYRGYNSNVHRGVHALSARATNEFERARAKVAAFISAASDREVVFTRNASEAINLVAHTWGLANLKPGDEARARAFPPSRRASRCRPSSPRLHRRCRFSYALSAQLPAAHPLNHNPILSPKTLLVKKQILTSVAEHHSGLVPWQLVAARTGAVLRHVGLDPATQGLDMADFRAQLSSRTKLISLVHVSNVLGAVTDTELVASEARRVGAKLLLDCCQSLPHMPVDVRALGADWIVASSHKMCGPTGIGFLWGRAEVLESMPPWMGGGEMIQDVFLDHSTYAPPPARFEAGTPAIAEAIGLGAACDYLSALGMQRVHAYEAELGGYLYERLQSIPGVTVYGPAPGGARGRASLAAFNVEGLHATDVSTILDASGVAVRSGHHCTQPLHRYLGVPASARASAYIYNTTGEVDAFIDALRETVAFFASVNGTS